jgi:branched-chain amino acid transport system permease protein
MRRASLLRSPLLRSPLLVTLLLVALLYGLPFALGPYWQQLGFRALQLLTLAIAWNVLAGFCGQVSLGTGAFVGLGAYAFALSGNRLGLVLPLQLATAGVVAAGFAALASVALFRLRGLYFTVGTLALAEALRILMVNLGTFGGASGIVLHAATPAFHQLYWLSLSLACWPNCCCARRSRSRCARCVMTRTWPCRWACAVSASSWARCCSRPCSWAWPVACRR